MARDTGDRFVHTFELLPSQAQARELDIRARLARDIYNGCLREGRRRLWHVRHDPAWLQAKLLPPGKARREAFQAVQARHGFTETALRLCVTPHKNRRAYQYGPLPYEGSRQPLRQAHYYDHLDGRTCHELAKRAWQSLEASLYQRGHGMARTRRRDEDIAVPCPDIALQEGTMRWHSPLAKLRVPLKLDPDNPVQAYALQHTPVEYGKRILRRMIRGEERWYVQVTYAGEPLWQDKHAIGDQVLGLDLGPSALAVVWDGGATTLRFCAGLEHDYAKIRRMQRYLDRSRRATNPQCFCAQPALPSGQDRTHRALPRLCGPAQKYAWPVGARSHSHRGDDQNRGPHLQRLGPPLGQKHRPQWRGDVRAAPTPEMCPGGGRTARVLDERDQI